MFKLAFLNLFRRKSRTFLALLAVTFGVAAIIVAIALVDGIYQDALQSFGGMNGVLLYQKGALDIPFSAVNLSYKSKLESVSGVKRVVPEISKMIKSIEGKSTSAGDIMNAPWLIAQAPEDLQYSLASAAYTHIVSGRLPSSGDTGYVLIHKDLSDRLNKPVNSTLRIEGKKFKIIGVFETDSSFLSNMVIMNISDARDLFHVPRSTVSIFTIVPNNNTTAEKLANVLKFRFGDDFEVFTSQTFASQLDAIISQLRTLVFIVASISGFIAALGVMNTLLMSIFERTREFGVLRATGWTKDRILALVMLEALFISIIGALLGCMLGWFVAQSLSTLVPMALHTYLFVLAFLFSTVVGLIAGVYPAYRAANIVPVEALRYE